MKKIKQIVYNLLARMPTGVLASCVQDGAAGIYVWYELTGLEEVNPDKNPNWVEAVELIEQEINKELEKFNLFLHQDQDVFLVRTPKIHGKLRDFDTSPMNFIQNHTEIEEIWDHLGGSLIDETPTGLFVGVRNGEVVELLATWDNTPWEETATYYYYNLS